MATEEDSGFVDPLAATLWQARASRQAVPRADWPGLELDRARAVAEELYARLDAEGARRVGAKVGATDAAAQAFLGASEPLPAPIYEEVLIEDGATLALADLMSPIFEAEIGMRLEEDGSVTLMPCIEIPQSRFAGGDPAIAYVTADFASQGGMVFGSPSAPPDRVAVRVTVDGEEIRTGERTVSDARKMLKLARERVGLKPGDLVATGTLFVPPPVTAGEWVVDFGDFGRLSLTVR